MKKNINLDPSVVTGVHLASIGALTNFIDKFPELTSILAKSKHPSSDWDFFMTSAGVALAVSLMEHKNTETIINKASEIDSQIPSAINNFFEFLKKNNSIDDEIYIQIGLWVLWNIGDECPSHNDCYRLAPAIGNYLKNVIEDFVIND